MAANAVVVVLAVVAVDFSHGTIHGPLCRSISHFVIFHQFVISVPRQSVFCSFFLFVDFFRSLMIFFRVFFVVFQALKSMKWMDRSTRAVSFEFTTFNPNVNLFSQVKMLIEMPASGGVFPYAT